MIGCDLVFKGGLTSEIIFFKLYSIMLLEKSRITHFILKEMLFPFQRYKYFKLLVFWQLCDVTADLHQFHTVYGLITFLCVY